MTASIILGKSLNRLRDITSNITIKNASEAQTFIITGIFIQQLFYADCSSSVFDNHGQLYGTMWSSATTFNPSASSPLGAGYLYSMIMSYLYEAASEGGPAATTPGSSTGKWCIQLGILQGGDATYPTNSVITNTTSSASLSNVVTWVSGSNPTPIAITCDDSTQQCTAAHSTQQTFPL